MRDLVDFRAEGMPLDDVARLIETRLTAHLLRFDHPGFQAFFNTVPDEAARRRLICRFDLDITRPEWALGYRWDVVLRGRDTTPMEE